MKKINLNSALFVGIDAHQEEHTAVMATRFEEERSSLRFANNTRGINQFMAWLENSQGNKPLLSVLREGVEPEDTWFPASWRETTPFGRLILYTPNKGETTAPGAINQILLMPCWWLKFSLGSLTGCQD